MQRTVATPLRVSSECTTILEDRHLLHMQTYVKSISAVPIRIVPFVQNNSFFVIPLPRQQVSSCPSTAGTAVQRCIAVCLEHY
jgi:hypothetical protein